MSSDYYGGQAGEIADRGRWEWVDCPPPWHCDADCTVACGCTCHDPERGGASDEWVRELTS